MGLAYRASAPGRCGILGNPSDIYGGKVLSCSLEARATCQLVLDDGVSLPDDLRLWTAATSRFPIVRDASVTWTSAIPRSSGLAGSTALLTATIACVLAAHGRSHEASQDAGFAELVRDVERHEAGVMCGYQDAYMTVHGGLQLMDFRGKHPVQPGPPATLQALDAGTPFLLVSTGVQRLSGSVHGPMSERWIRNEPGVREAIASISKLAEPGAQALVDQEYGLLAELMSENQALISELGGSGDAIDALVSTCKECGALGAKLAGAGMGGTVIALTLHPDDLEQRLRARGYSLFLRPQISAGVRFERGD